MRVTSKGQVTIPIEFRKRYGIDEAVEVEFEPQPDGLLLRVCEEESARHAVERMQALGRKHARQELSTYELMRLMRGWGEDDPGFGD